jgi:DNA-binding SARP family transcriptional activator
VALPGRAVSCPESPERLSAFRRNRCPESLDYTADWPSGDWVLAPLQRVPLAEASGLQATIEAQLMANSALVDQYGLSDVCQQAWAHPDDRPVTTVLVLDGALARQWGPLLIAGRQLGLAAIILGGEDLPAARQLRIGEDGTLSVQGPGVEPTDALVPCLLTADLAGELASAVVPEPEVAELVFAEEAASVTAAPHVPDGVIRLHLLGGPLRVLDAAGNEVPQYGGRRATREVLAYLALHPDGVRRETLIEALWEAEDFRDPTGELQTAISEARRWLVNAAREAEEGKVLRGSGLQFIAHKAGVYRLLTERVWVDVHAFERAVAPAAAQPEDELLLRAVVEAYDGDLLPGADAREAFSWLEREGMRFELQKQVGWAAVHLAEVLREKCRPAEALAMLAPFLDSIVNDDLWLQAMLCEGEPPPRGHGARERVMQLYRRHERRLRQLDLEPSGRTQEVYASLLAASDGRQRLVALRSEGAGNLRKRRAGDDGGAPITPDLRVLR